MLEFFKLKSLPKKQRQQKLVKIFEQLEIALVHNKTELLLDDFYLKQLFDVAELDFNAELKSLKATYFSGGKKPDNKKMDEKLLLINRTRHRLYELTGVEPSEWDLILPTDKAFSDKNIKRQFFKNVFVYVEALRSPFNLGSIFRTSDAFGVEKLFLSLDCVSEKSQRAKRSAMGCIEFVSHERKSLLNILETLPKNFPVIALETGGENINEFQFPSEGILLIGSEELGLSPESLKLAKHRLSIKMQGIKASINVGVAFGICMEKWASSLNKIKIKQF